MMGLHDLFYHRLAKDPEVLDFFLYYSAMSRKKISAFIS